MAFLITEFGREINRFWLLASLMLAGLSAVSSVLWGPFWMGSAACAGFLFAGFNWVLWRKEQARYPGPALAGTLLILHAGFIIGALVLQQMFLSTLSDDRLTPPVFRRGYAHPSGAFSIRLPENWFVDPLQSSKETGLRLSPDGYGAYMGIAEAQIRIREIEKPPKNSARFLADFANSFRPGERLLEGKQFFTFKTEAGVTLRKKPAVWTVLDLRRLWVPLRQTTFLTVRNNRSIVTISATGLAAHSTLHRVFCLGLLETLQTPASIKKGLQIESVSRYN